jgi:hypothetical protein
LCGGDLGMVCMTQHFEPSSTCGVGLQVVMAPWSVTLAIAGLNVIDLTIAPRCGTANANAMVFGSTLGGRASKSPDVFTLPCTTTFV